MVKKNSKNKLLVVKTNQKKNSLDNYLQKLQAFITKQGLILPGRSSGWHVKFSATNKNKVLMIWKLQMIINAQKQSYPEPSENVIGLMEKFLGPDYFPAKKKWLIEEFLKREGLSFEENMLREERESLDTERQMLVLRMGLNKMTIQELQKFLNK